MSRLTEWQNGELLVKEEERLLNANGVITKDEMYKIMRHLAEQLADYEDKQEQGMLIELPCKVGAVVFCIFERRTKCTEHGQEFDDYSCQGCECLECDSRKDKYVHEMKAYSLDWIIANINNFGKTVFLTRSEAEEALARMKGE